MFVLSVILSLKESIEGVTSRDDVKAIVITGKIADVC